MSEPAHRVPDDDALLAMFRDGAIESLTELKAASQALVADPEGEAGLLPRMAELVHVLKGQGSSFGFPLVTQIGTSGMRLLKGRTTADAWVAGLIAAHIDALHVVIDKSIQGDGGEFGAALVARLDSLVAKAT